jgi:hypothetical protein
MSRQIQSRAAQRVNLSLDSRVPLLEGDVDEVRSNYISFSRNFDNHDI